MTAVEGVVLVVVVLALVGLGMAVEHARQSGREREFLRALNARERDIDAGARLERRRILEEARALASRPPDADEANAILDGADE